MATTASAPIVPPTTNSHNVYEINAGADTAVALRTSAGKAGVEVLTRSGQAGGEEAARGGGEDCM